MYKTTNFLLLFSVCFFVINIISNIYVYESCRISFDSYYRISREDIILDIDVNDSITSAVLYYEDWTRIRKQHTDITIDRIEDTIKNAYAIYESNGNIAFFIKDNLCVKVEGLDDKIVGIIDFSKPDSQSYAEFVEDNTDGLGLNLEAIRFIYPEEVLESKNIWIDMVIYLSLYEIFKEISFWEVEEYKVRRWLDRGRTGVEQRLIERASDDNLIFYSDSRLTDYILRFLEFHNSNSNSANIDSEDFLKTLHFLLIDSEKVLFLLEKFGDL